MTDTKVITPEAILSYPYLREPQANDSGKLFHTATLIFPEETDISPVKNIVRNAIVEKFGAEAEGLIHAKKIRLPFRNDWEKKGYPENSTFFSCKSKVAPGIVGLAPGSDGRPAPYEGEIYAGLYVRASIQAYYYPQQGGGIGIGLRNIQVLRDGPRMDNRVPASEEFEADTNAPQAGAADIADLL